MTPAGDGFTVENSGDVMVVRFEGSGFLDEEKVQLVAKDLFEVVSAREAPRVVLDMSVVKFCSSTIIGKFVALYKHVVGLGGKIKFASLSGAIHQVFKITKLDRLFEVYKTTDDAISSFEKKS